MTWTNMAELGELGSAVVLGLGIGLRRALLRSTAYVADGIRSLSVNSRGVIAIEAAVLLPVFVMFVLGGFDLSVWTLQANAVQTGLTAGGTYVMNNSSPAGTEEVVKASSGLLQTAQVTVAPVGNKVTITVSVPFMGFTTTWLPLPTTITAHGTFMQFSNGGNSAKKATHWRYA